MLSLCRPFNYEEEEGEEVRGKKCEEGFFATESTSLLFFLSFFFCLKFANYTELEKTWLSSLQLTYTKQSISDMALKMLLKKCKVNVFVCVCGYTYVLVCKGI